MNRAERRKAVRKGLPVKEEAVVNMKASDVEKIKQDASKHVESVVLMSRVDK